ncbi:amino acid/polyamine/organocation transporter (APC superfamily) [Pelolinea submarina]|uniref:Amino acid/polyamine/organocation transporter (APC superfamily) n=2 Tax=Pelolinea submarina TaxID=913107 RepID=A0A3E0AB67_9CHLR|nr:amino acid/polyamine/organocation transporter (APC superfamily) [Pelolinea submarina]
MIKHFFIGSPIPTLEQKENRLNKVRALAAFSPDALSSIAYANQEIFLALVVAGSSGLSLSFPIGLAITGLLVLVALSYFQTIQGYPSGGGSYIVARENLGITPGLAAAASLLVDYTLTAAVSLTAGVAAIASSFPILWEYQTPLALFFLLVITIINLRGIRETGTAMAVPVYLFLVTYLLMLAYGVIQALLTDGFVTEFNTLPASKPLSTLLILEAFSAGCTALTGIEAISNGVPVFEKPEVKNAGKTLLIMAFLMALLFVGSIGLTQFLNVLPEGQETILSALAHRILGNGFGYILIQISSTLILVVAANTSFAGFPRLAAILASDGFLPKPLTQLGDRLVYSYGIVTLSALTGLLIILFKGDSHALVPLFAVGVFVSFTLSQSGMVLHWWKTRGKNWKLKLTVNGIGAIATGCATLVIGSTKFLKGAWISILLIPLIVHMFYKVRDHYQSTAAQLSLSRINQKRKKEIQSFSSLRVVLPISSLHIGIVEAVKIAKQISDNIQAVYIEIEPDSGIEVKEKWEKYFQEIPLVILPSPYRSIISPLLDYLDKYDRESADNQLAAVILPELIPAKRWHQILHNQSARLIKSSLLYRRRNLGFQRVIIDVPYHLNE